MINRALEKELVVQLKNPTLWKVVEDKALVHIDTMVKVCFIDSIYSSRVNVLFSEHFYTSTNKELFESVETYFEVVS